MTKPKHEPRKGYCVLMQTQRPYTSYCPPQKWAPMERNHQHTTLGFKVGYQPYAVF